MIKNDESFQNKSFLDKASCLSKAIAILSLAMGSNSFADEQVQEANDKKEAAVVSGNKGSKKQLTTAQNTNAIVLDTLNVYASKEEQAGKVVLDSQTINLMPSSTGTVTDTLRGRSDVQFDSGSRSGSQGGEIRPPKISIKGSRPYENNYTINGVGTSNLINPIGLGSANDVQSASGVPQGDAQSFFFDRRLLDNVTVMSENVSAEYGAFQGGVVDAKLRNARMDRFHFDANYRHTRNSWAKLYYDPKWTEEDLEARKLDGKYQNKFQRHEYTLVADGPINDKLGILLSYNEARSDIVKPTTWAGDKNEQRIRQNYLGKISFPELENGFSGALSYAYAPYDQKMYMRANRDSQYNITQGGHLLTFELNKTWAGIGTLKNTFGFQDVEVSREASGNKSYSWRKYDNNGNLSKYATWGNDSSYASLSRVLSTEGGFGNYETKQRTFSIKSTMIFEPIYIGNLTNNLKMGYEIENIRASVDREEATAYSTPTFFGTGSQVLGSDEGVIPGEQYAKQKAVTPALRKQVYLRNYAGFIENSFHYDRLMVRSGVRYTYDNLSKDHHIAPRLYTEFDVFNDRTLILNAGANRYYGTPLLGYALRSGGGVQRYTRTAGSGGGEWSKSTLTNQSYYDVGDLKIPHSDELTLGFMVNALDTKFTVLYTERKMRNQLRSSNRWVNGISTTTYNNNGQTDYRGITFGATKEFDFGSAGKHLVELSATRSDLKTNGTQFDSSMDEAEIGGLATTVDIQNAYYKGSLVSASDIPASNYNRPWVVTLNHMAMFNDDRIRLYNLLRYEYKAKSIKRNGSVVVNNTRYWRYEDKVNPSTITYDMTLEWDAYKKDDHALTLFVEVNNVFNRKNYSDTAVTDSSAGNDYSMGRQFFVGFNFSY